MTLDDFLTTGIDTKEVNNLSLTLAALNIGIENFIYLFLMENFISENVMCLKQNFYTFCNALSLTVSFSVYLSVFLPFVPLKSQITMSL